MKTTLLPLINRPLNLILAFMLFLVLPSCHDEVKSTFTYKTQIPVYLEMSSVRNTDIIIEQGRELDNPGKIYIYGDF